MLNERLIPGIDNGINGGDLKRVNFCMEPTVIETDQEERNIGDLASTEMEQADVDQITTEPKQDVVQPMDAQIQRLVADANEQWTNMMESVQSTIPDVNKQPVIEDLPAPDSFAEFDMDAFLRRVKANPQLAKALATSVSKWEEELMEDIESEFNPVEPRPPPKPPMEPPSTPPPPEPPPGSLLSELARPPSPTDICDFPFFDLDNENTSFKLQPSTASILPRFQVSKTKLQEYYDDVLQTQESIDDWDDDEMQVSEVTEYSVIADIGTYGRTFKINRSAADRGDLADSGANCCMTANLSALSDVTKLTHPIVIGLAVTADGSISSSSECTHVGKLTIKCDDGSSFKTNCFYNPNASDTIISPQAIIDESQIFTSWSQTGRKFGQPGQINFIGPEGTKSITLQQYDGLYYISASTFEIFNENMMEKQSVLPKCDKFTANRVEVMTQTDLEGTPKRQPPKTSKFKPVSKAKALESETWYLRMGGCNETQLDQLPKHAVGIPSKFEWHPFRFIDFKEQARVRKQAAGKDPIKVALRGQRFYMDYGFIRASNDDFSRPNIKKDRVVESFDGYTSYLLVVDEVSKHSWIFLTKSKEPPIELCKLFMKQFANEDGGFIRCDQGGELARSTDWRTAMLKEFQYVVEPTGADSPSQNGQVERYNDTVATITRTLLYGANLPAKYWSVAAVHAVYLMNRRVHSAINTTPYEAWYDEKPDLSTLKVFGSRVCVKVTGKRRSKLDRHDFTGIFIGYTATDENIRYIDVDSGVVKTSHHAVFDEAWYLQPSRPPMAQLLFEMGLEQEDETCQAPPSKPRPIASWPPTASKEPSKLPSKAIQTPIPLRMTEAPISRQEAAAAAKLAGPYHQTAIDARINRLDIIDDMRLDKEETFAQVYLSPSPYFEAFQEEIDIKNWTTHDHHTAGFVFVSKNDRLVLADILKSTPAARIDKWRSRCRGAAVLEVEGRPVTTAKEVETILKNLKDRDITKCRITLAHPEIKAGLTSQGIPQLHIDQLNTRFIMNVDHIVRQEALKVHSGGVLSWKFNKLTRGKLLKTPEWDEWKKAEWLQLDQYYDQGMFGDPTFVTDYSQVFHLVWTYMVKDLNARKKARMACDGSTRGGKARILDYTHANCIDHTASRLFYGISAAENLLIFGADVGNAFAEAPPPKQGFYILPDRAFKEWWEAKGLEPLKEGKVIPVMRAMQGHPESSRLWEKHIDRIIRKYDFKPTVHEPCLYIGYVRGERCIFKRQVDDFAIATENEETAKYFFDILDDELTMPMKRLGLITLFNGVDVLQSKYFVKISCQTYLEKISKRHLENWMNDMKMYTYCPLPMPATESFTKAFDAAVGDPDKAVQTALEKEYHFAYRSGIGEIIYAMVTARPDVSTAVVRCAQHSACPAKAHYNAVRHILKYLYLTRDDGIYYWRARPLESLPEHPVPNHHADCHGVIPSHVSRPIHHPLEPVTSADSNWAACLKTSRSTTGLCVKIAGGVIAYKTKLQPTVANSTTEAEFMGGHDAGKMVLFLRSIMYDLGIPQQAASIIYEDNDGAIAMANAQKPTPRTRHMDIKYFALAEWVERDLMILERIHTSINEADHFTKVLDRTLFYRHIDHIMGHIPPPYSPCFDSGAWNAGIVVKDEDFETEVLAIRPEVARAAKCQASLGLWTDILSHGCFSNPICCFTPHRIVGGC